MELTELLTGNGVRAYEDTSKLAAAMTEHYGNWVNPATGERLSHTSSTCVNTSLGWKPADAMGVIITPSYPPLPLYEPVIRPSVNYGQSIGPGSSAPYVPRVKSEFEKAVGRAVWFLFKWLFVALVAVGLIGALGYIEFTKLDRSWRAEDARGPMVYSPGKLKLFTFIPHLRGVPAFLPGRDVVVAGDVENLNIYAYKNLTVRGKVSGSRISSTLGTLTVENVENSFLEAHRIVVKGTSVNTKEGRIPGPLASKAAPAKRHR